MSSDNRYVVGCLCLLLGVATSVHSQDGQQRRQFLDGLLKTLIESQLPAPPATPQQTPSSGEAANARAVAPAAAPKIREAAQLLTQAADEMSQLVVALQSDIYRSQGVRQLLTEAMRVNANASALARRMAYGADSESLREYLRQLDQDWRALEYRLVNTENLSAQTRGYIQRVKEYEQRIAELFQVAPQVDLEAVSGYATQMAASIRSLQDDIHFEVADRELASHLLVHGRRVDDKAQALVQLTQLPTATFAKVRKAYQDLDHDWQLMESELRPINNRFIQRQTQRIEGANRQLHELLRYAAELDREDLLQSTRLLLQDLEQLMGQITLKMLVDLPGARNFAVLSAGDFEIACRDFAETAEAGDVVDTLRDLYLYLHDEWERLSIALRGIESQPVRRSLRDIGNSVDSIQAMLGVVPEFDRDQALSLGSSITTAAKYIQGDLQQHFSRPNRYPREFQTDTLQTAARFQKASQLLYAGIANGNKLRQLKTDCDALAAEWETLSRMVPRFDLAQQQRLGTYRRELTPQIVEMQTLLSL